MTAPFRRLRLPNRSTWRDPPLPSLNFLILCLLFVGSGAAMWHGLIVGKGAVIVFVLSGWVVSLCMHEFGHALVAYRGGDTSVSRSGYLDLDPLAYTDPVLSILLPLIYLLIGGFGLPGGAVWINHGAIRSKLWDAGVSAAGPFANVLALLALAALYHALPDDTPSELAGGIAVLAFFQSTAIVLNLLPIPGLDGFGILRPFLPGRVAEVGTAMAAGAGFLLVLLVLMWRPAAELIFGVGLHITNALGIYDVGYGYRMLKIF